MNEKKRLYNPTAGKSMKERIKQPNDDHKLKHGNNKVKKKE